MNKDNFSPADESPEQTTQNIENPAPIPPDEPPVDWISLDQISPLAGALAGGISITLLGSGFQPGAVVYFGNVPAEQVVFESSAVIYAVVPPASEAGSVSVSVINPDGLSAMLAGGFTYVTTATGEHAEVLGVTPLAVLENTQSVVTIRGRSLIAAYNNGLLALRGPSRCQITFLNTTTSHDAETGIDTVRMTVEINCSPPLQSYERMAVQVLASRRSGAANDGIVESSRQMFTVLPNAAPAALAYTATLEPSKPNLVMVAGRNLDGCALTLSDGTEVEFQKSSGNFLSGIVTLPENYDAPAPLRLAMVDKGGATFAEYDLSLSTEGAMLLAETENNPAEPGSGELNLNLTPVPGQQFTGPTQEDSAVFSANGQNLSSLEFNWGNFAITIIDITIILPIVNEVYMISFFDGGGGTLNSPVVAEVGKLFRLRGAGLLVALRVEVQIHIQVVLIIGFIYEIWGYGLYNEFPQFGWSIGSIVIGIQINIEIYIIVSWMTALIKPNGQLEVIAAFNLTLGIDFSIDSSGHLHFDPIFTHAVHIIGITSMPNNLLPCGGKFQLLSENGQTSFPDARGGFESYYFVREAGECCVPWDFNMELVRFTAGGQQEVVQSSFQASHCLTATESPVLYDVVITSEPPPTGFPPLHLVMDVGERAAIKAFAREVDASGNPTGAPMIDLRDLGYDVEFFLVDPANTVLDPVALPPGQAYAFLPGSNNIRARIKLANNQTPLAFWKNSVYGFRRSPNSGEAPSWEVGNLPVTVNQVTDVKVELSLAYRDAATGKVEAVKDMYRDEPDAANPRSYFLAGKFRFPPNTPSSIKVKVKVDSATLLVANQSNVSPFPADTFGSQFDRSGGTALSQFFSGQLIQSGGVEVEVTLNSLPPANEYVQFDNAELLPNREESPATGGITKYVPPGPKVTAHLLSACRKTDRNSQTCRRDVKVELKFSSLEVTDSSGSTRLGSTLLTSKLDPMIANEETFEEYFRVFREVRALMAQRSSRSGSGTLGSFARELINALASATSVSEAVLRQKGKDLWTLGCQFVQGGTADDRILYFARLEAMAVLRDLHRRKLTAALSDDQLNIFEYSSRGLATTNGTDARIEFETGDTNRVVVTGFDPFLLYAFGLISNSSGLIALSLNGTPITAGSPSKTFKVRTAVFPVRFRDFGTTGTDTPGLVEKVMAQAVNECELIMTCSWQGDLDRFSIDRFATRYRTTTTTDNEKLESSRTHPLGTNVSSVPYYLESTLPYRKEGVVKVPVSPGSTTFINKRVTGPAPTNYLILDQKYTLETVTGSCSSRLTGQLDTADAYERNLPTPNGCGEVKVGSGGDYLSNEIFYRTSRIRWRTKPSLPTGHLHVPSIGTDPYTDDKGRKVSAGGKEILTSLLPYAASLTGTNQVNFPDTQINSAGSTATISISVPANYPNEIQIAVVEFSQSQTIFRVDPFSPVTIQPGAGGTIDVKFFPTEVREYTETIKLKTSDGMVLHIAQLKGKGIAPAPIITSFDPLTGYEGDMITITGQNFDGATDVSIGGVPVYFTVANPTTIYAEVSFDVFRGLITVTTPGGTATSATIFRRIIPREQEPI